MNRLQEFEQLLREAAPPENLRETIDRSVSRARRADTARRVAVCACAPLAVLVVFTALVNLLPGFALACQKVPVLRDLAQAVSFSPSLRAAVENGYVQRIDQEQSKDGITMRIEYVIVDRKQLNVFFRLSSKNHPHLDALPTISTIDGGRLQGYSITSSDFNEPNGTLRSFTVNFVQGDMPTSLLLDVRVQEQQHTDGSQLTEQRPQDAQASETAQNQFTSIANFSFPLTFDQAFTQKGEIIALSKSFQLDGQTMIAESLEIYPTHIRFTLKDDSNNTAWLKELRFYLQDEKGRRYDPPANGLTAMGSPNSPMTASYWLESSYFAQSKKLTLYITGATWLDKTQKRTRVNLTQGTADNLPQGVVLEQARRDGDRWVGNWVLYFSGELCNGRVMPQLFDQDYYDEQGKRYEVNEWMSNYDEQKQTRFHDEFPLIDYPYDVVYLSPSFSYVTTEQSPVEIKLK